MAAVDDVGELVERYHLAQGEFLKGDPEPAKRFWSHRDDVSLANPYGGSTEAEDVRIVLELIQSLTLEVSEDLDAYQERHSGQ